MCIIDHFACQLRSIDVMPIKKANKVSSIPRSILLYESIVDIDIDTSKVSSIISTSIFDITNPAKEHGYLQECGRRIVFTITIAKNSLHYVAWPTVDHSYRTEIARIGSHYAVQSHSRSLIFVPTEGSYATPISGPEVLFQDLRRDEIRG